MKKGGISSATSVQFCYTERLFCIKKGTLKKRAQSLQKGTFSYSLKALTAASKAMSSNHVRTKCRECLWIFSTSPSPRLGSQWARRCPLLCLYKALQVSYLNNRPFTLTSVSKYCSLLYWRTIFVPYYMCCIPRWTHGNLHIIKMIHR